MTEKKLSERGAVMVSVGLEIFRRYDFEKQLTLERWIALLAAKNRVPPTGTKGVGLNIWANHQRYALNVIGRNRELLEDRGFPANAAENGFQLECVRNNLYELRTISQSLLRYDHMKRTLESAAVSTDRMSEFGPFVDEEYKGFWRDLRKVAQGVTQACIANERRRQRLLLAIA